MCLLCFFFCCVAGPVLLQINNMGLSDRWFDRARLWRLVLLAGDGGRWWDATSGIAVALLASEAITPQDARQMTKGDGCFSVRSPPPRLLRTLTLPLWRLS